MILLLVSIVAQVIRPAKNEGTANGPKDIVTVASVPDGVVTILKKSCYDCHSNHSDNPSCDQIKQVN